MTKYENEQIGKIIVIKYMIFQNNPANMKEVDHAWRLGRPCVIIYSDDNYDYVLPLTSSIVKEKYTDEYFLLKNNHLLHYYKKTKGAINLRTIYKIPVSGHIETAKLTFKAYKNLIEELKKFHKLEDLNTILENAQPVRGK